jgi:hypothetical protein
VVFGGLVIPAMVGSYLLIGVQEQQSARTALNESLQRNADILALGMQESLWNMNADPPLAGRIGDARPVRAARPGASARPTPSS